MDYSKNNKAVILLLFFCQGAIAAPTKQLLQLYHNSRTTFFCNQIFTETGNLISLRNKHNPIVDESVAWMQIVPLKELAPFFACYHQPCLDKKGKRLQGVRCCQKMDVQFKRMRNDFHNIVPETPLLKKLRERYSFAEFTKPPIKASTCHFYVDKKTKQLEPAPHTRGMIARTYLYMKDTYPFRLTEAETALYLSWHQRYPVTAAERDRNEKIFELQGKRNHWVG